MNGPVNRGNGVPLQPPDLAAGLTDADREAEWLARWPHLSRPGPQPCNRIAPTPAEQLARARRGRPDPARRRRARRRRWLRRVMMDCLAVELPEAVAALVADCLAVELPEAVAALVADCLAVELPEAVAALVADCLARRKGRAAGKAGRVQT
jgi:hypothetical protein